MFWLPICPQPSLSFNDDIQLAFSFLKKFSLSILHPKANEGKLPQRFFLANFDEPSRRKETVSR